MQYCGSERATSLKTCYNLQKSKEVLMSCEQCMFKTSSFEDYSSHVRKHISSGCRGVSQDAKLRCRKYSFVANSDSSSHFPLILHDRKKIRATTEKSKNELQKMCFDQLKEAKSPNVPNTLQSKKDCSAKQREFPAESTDFTNDTNISEQFQNDFESENLNSNDTSSKNTENQLQLPSSIPSESTTFGCFLRPLLANRESNLGCNSMMHEHKETQSISQEAKNESQPGCLDQLKEAKSYNAQSTSQSGEDSPGNHSAAKSINSANNTNLREKSQTFSQSENPNYNDSGSKDHENKPQLPSSGPSQSTTICCHLCSFVAHSNSNLRSHLMSHGPEDIPSLSEEAKNQSQPMILDQLKEARSYNAQNALQPENNCTENHSGFSAKSINSANDRNLSDKSQPDIQSENPNYSDTGSKDRGFEKQVSSSGPSQSTAYCCHLCSFVAHSDSNLRYHLMSHGPEDIPSISKKAKNESQPMLLDQLKETRSYNAQNTLQPEKDCPDNQSEFSAKSINSANDRNLSDKSQPDPQTENPNYSDTGPKDRGFEKQVSSSSPSQSTSYCCQLCSFVAHSDSNLRYHLMSHGPEDIPSISKEAKKESRPMLLDQLKEARSYNVQNTLHPEKYCPDNHREFPAKSINSANDTKLCEKSQTISQSENPNYNDIGSNDPGNEQHVSTSGPSHSKTYPCQLCSFVAHSDINLRYHLLLHEAEVIPSITEEAKNKCQPMVLHQFKESKYHHAPGTLQFEKDCTANYREFPEKSTDLRNDTNLREKSQPDYQSESPNYKDTGSKDSRNEQKVFSPGPSQSKTFCCHLCSFVAHNYNNLRYHLMLHGPEDIPSISEDAKNESQPTRLDLLKGEKSYKAPSTLQSEKDCLDNHREFSAKFINSANDRNLSDKSQPNSQSENPNYSDTGSKDSGFKKQVSSSCPSQSTTFCCHLCSFVAHTDSNLSYHLMLHVPENIMSINEEEKNESQPMSLDQLKETKSYSAASILQSVKDLPNKHSECPDKSTDFENDTSIREKSQTKNLNSNDTPPKDHGNEQNVSPSGLSQSKTYPCQLCSFVANSDKTICYHLMVHEAEGIPSITDEAKNESQPIRLDQLKKMKSHNSPGTLQYERDFPDNYHECPAISTNFGNNRNLRDKIQSENPNSNDPGSKEHGNEQVSFSGPLQNKTFPCHLCSFVANSDRNLRYHLIFRGPEAIPFITEESRNECLPLCLDQLQDAKSQNATRTLECEKDCSDNYHEFPHKSSDFGNDAHRSEKCHTDYQFQEAIHNHTYSNDNGNEHKLSLSEQEKGAAGHIKLSLSNVTSEYNVTAVCANRDFEQDASHEERSRNKCNSNDFMNVNKSTNQKSNETIAKLDQHDFNPFYHDNLKNVQENINWNSTTCFLMRGINLGKLNSQKQIGCEFEFTDLSAERFKSPTAVGFLERENNKDDAQHFSPHEENLCSERGSLNFQVIPPLSEELGESTLSNVAALNQVKDRNIECTSTSQNLSEEINDLSHKIRSKFQNQLHSTPVYGNSSIQSFEAHIKSLHEDRNTNNCNINRNCGSSSQHNFDTLYSNGLGNNPESIKLNSKTSVPKEDINLNTQSFENEMSLSGELLAYLEDILLKTVSTENFPNVGNIDTDSVFGFTRTEDNSIECNISLNFSDLLHLEPKNNVRNATGLNVMKNRNFGSGTIFQSSNKEIEEPYNKTASSIQNKFLSATENEPKCTKHLEGLIPSNYSEKNEGIKSSSKLSSCMKKDHNSVPLSNNVSVAVSDALISQNENCTSMNVFSKKDNIVSCDNTNSDLTAFDPSSIHLRDLRLVSNAETITNTTYPTDKSYTLTSDNYPLNAKTSSYDIPKHQNGLKNTSVLLQSMSKQLSFPNSILREEPVDIDSNNTALVQVTSNFSHKTRYGGGRCSVNTQKSLPSNLPPIISYQSFTKQTEQSSNFTSASCINLDNHEKKEEKRKAKTLQNSENTKKCSDINNEDFTNTNDNLVNKETESVTDRIQIPRDENNHLSKSVEKDGSVVQRSNSKRNKISSPVNSICKPIAPKKDIVIINNMFFWTDVNSATQSTTLPATDNKSDNNSLQLNTELTPTGHRQNNISELNSINQTALPCHQSNVTVVPNSSNDDSSASCQPTCENESDKKTSKENPQNFSCPICQKQFTCESLVNLHEDVHKKMTYFMCEFCEKRYSRVDTLRKHLRFHNSEENSEANANTRKHTMCGKIGLTQEIGNGESENKSSETSNVNKNEINSSVESIIDKGERQKLDNNKCENKASQNCSSKKISIETSQNRNSKKIKISSSQNRNSKKIKITSSQNRNLVFEENEINSSEICDINKGDDKSSQKCDFDNEESSSTQSYDINEVYDESTPCTANNSSSYCVTYEDGNNNKSETVSIKTSRYNTVNTGLNNGGVMQANDICPKCYLCDRAFKCALELQEHIKIHTSNHLPTIKILSLPEFEDQNNTISENSKADNDGSKNNDSLLNQLQYRCHYCDKTFRYKCKLKRHMITHDMRKLFVCEICLKSYKRLESLKFHSITHGKCRKGPYVCSQCGTECKGEHDLFIHEKRHEIERPCRCLHCSYTCRNNNDLRKHIIRRHTRNFKYNCSMCKKGFITPKELKMHEARKHMR